MRDLDCSSRTGWTLLTIIALAAFGLMFQAARVDSPIMDELAHIPAGYGYVAYLNYQLNPEHPPLVKTLAALPLAAMDLRFPVDRDAWTRAVNAEWTVGRQFLFDSGNNANQIVLAARVGPMLLTLLTTAFIYFWSTRLFGHAWGLLPALLFGLSPHVLAHGHYVTTDVAAAFGVLVATWTLLEYLRVPSGRRLMSAGFAFGIAQICKFSAVLLVPYFLLLVACWAAIEVRARWRAAAGVVAIFAIGYLFVVYPTYFVLTRGYAMSRQVSDTAANLSTYADGPTPAGRACRVQRCAADLVIWMSGQPLLRPFAVYAEGALMVQQRTSEGGKTYWLGRVAGRGSRWYFPLVYLLKEPLPLLLLIATGLGSAVLASGATFFSSTRRRQLAIDYLARDFTLFALALWCLVYGVSSLRSPLNIGFRHLFPTLPFVYMLTTSSLRRRAPEGRLAAGLLAAVLVWFGGETLAAAPHFLSSFNEIGGGTREGYRYVTDSNFDWGQDLRRLRAFVDAHPEIDRLAVDYFGGGMPGYYFAGSRSVEIWSSARGNPADEGVHWLAVSASVLQTAVPPAAGGLARPAQDEYRWLTAIRPREGGFGGVPRPDYRAGTSLFIYHLP